MGFRITSWNVNGIRNPFSYEPWREKKTYQAMFDILEADIVVMQETKIQRKDLQDDMVLVPGWDVHFSLPRFKKGYSGVAVYTRTSRCCPVRAEEGITGVLSPPNSAVRFRDLPPDRQIGGYPSPSQLLSSSGVVVDEATLDSEGRCVVLEFPAFVLIGVYSPAARDDTRTDFRLSFHAALDARVRNLVAMGKQVVLTGDLNIVRGELDTAGVAEQLRKEAMTMEDFLSMPSRQFLNHLLFGGSVVGEGDEGREQQQAVMWDLGREFHPARTGMYTCWETRRNARPGNFGSRIDYVLCSDGMRGWFVDADVQQGLLGSDHCPVYATLGERVRIEGRDVHLLDVMNPEGTFQGGMRLREWSARDLLPLSARLMPEFDRRRTIRDMFLTKKAAPTPLAAAEKEEASASQGENNTMTPSPTHPPTASSSTSYQPADATEQADRQESSGGDPPSLPVSQPASMSPSKPKPVPKRTSEAAVPASRPQKKSKSSASKNVSKSGPPRAQTNLMGFFKPKTLDTATQSITNDRNKCETASDGDGDNNHKTGAADDDDAPPTPPPRTLSATAGAPPPFIFKKDRTAGTQRQEAEHGSSGAASSDLADPGGGEDRSAAETVFDPIQNRESWSRLLGKRVAPRCEHGEPCISLLTKKPGVNCGRSFYICPRPLGPSGDKEKGTEWRCATFIWSSDWNPPVSAT